MFIFKAGPRKVFRLKPVRGAKKVADPWFIRMDQNSRVQTRPICPASHKHHQKILHRCWSPSPHLHRWWPSICLQQISAISAEMGCQPCSQHTTLSSVKWACRISSQSYEKLSRQISRKRRH